MSSSHTHTHTLCTFIRRQPHKETETHSYKWDIKPFIRLLHVHTLHSFDLVPVSHDHMSHQLLVMSQDVYYWATLMNQVFCKTWTEVKGRHSPSVHWQTFMCPWSRQIDQWMINRWNRWLFKDDPVIQHRNIDQRKRLKLSFNESNHAVEQLLFLSHNQWVQMKG